MDDSQTEQTTAEPTNSVSTNLPIDNNPSVAPAPVNPLTATTEEPPLMITQEEVEQATSKIATPVEVIAPQPLTPVLNERPAPTPVSVAEPAPVQPAPQAAPSPEPQAQTVVSSEPFAPPKPVATEPIAPTPEAMPNKQEHEQKVPINNAQPATSTTAPANLSGIYPTPTKSEIGVDTSGPNANKFFDEPKAEVQQSVIGVIGEVIGSTGIIMTFVMLAAPFYRDYLDSSLYQAIYTIGFLASFALVVLGFLLSLFLKGKGFFKFILFVFLLLTGVLYFGLNTSGSIAEFLNQYAAILLDYYQ